MEAQGPFDRGGGLGQRVDAELAAQELLQALELDHRGAAAAQAHQALDDRHPGRLAVLVDRGGAAEAGERGIVLARPGQCLAVLDEHGLDPVADPALRLLGPRIVQALERIALGERDGAGERLPAPRVLAGAAHLVVGGVEFPQVARQAERGVQAIELGVAQEERLGSPGQHAPQVGQGRMEVPPSRRRAAAGPERLEQFVAGHPARAEREQDQHVERALRAPRRCRERPSADPHLGRPEQHQAHRARRGAGGIRCGRTPLDPDPGAREALLDVAKRGRRGRRERARARARARGLGAQACGRRGTADLAQDRERRLADLRVGVGEHGEQRVLDARAGLDQRGRAGVDLDAAGERAQERPGLLPRLEAQEVVVAVLAHQGERALQVAVDRRRRAARRGRRAPAVEGEQRLGHPVVDAHPLVVVLAGLGRGDAGRQVVAGGVRAAGAELAPGELRAEGDQARCVGTLGQVLEGAGHEADGAQVLAAGAEDAAAQREQVGGQDVHAHLGVELLGAMECGDGAVEVAGVGEHLGQRLLGHRLVHPVGEALGRGERLLGGGAGLGQLAGLEQERGQVRQVEGRTRRGRAAHVDEGEAELARRVAEAAAGGVGDGQVVDRGHEQLGVGAAVEQVAHLVEQRDRRLRVAQVEVRGRLHLEQARARLEGAVADDGEPVLGHAEHLLVPAAQVEHLAETDEGAHLVVAAVAGARVGQHLLVAGRRLVPLANRLVGVGPGEAERGIGLERGRRELAEERQQRGRAALGEEDGGEGDEEQPGVLHLPGVERVAECALEVAAGLERAGRVGLERGQPGRTERRLEPAAHEAPHQVGAERVRGLGAGAEASHQAALDEQGDPPAGVLDARQGARQLGVEARQERGPLKQAAVLVLEAAVDLGRQVAGEVEGRVVERGQDVAEGRARPADQGLVDQVDGGRPAMRGLFERLDLLGRQRQREDVPEQPVELAAVEGEGLRVHLEHPAPGAQARERKRRLGPPGDPEAHPRRRVGEERVEHAGDRRVGRQLVRVVEHEVARRAAQGDQGVADQAGQVLGHPRPRADLAEHPLEVPAEAGGVAAERLHEVAGEDDRVAVGGGERVPQDGPAKRPPGRGQERRLAPAGVGHDEHEGALGVGHQGVDEPGPLEQERRRVRRLEAGPGRRGRSGPPAGRGMADRHGERALRSMVTGGRVGAARGWEEPVDSSAFKPWVDSGARSV